MKQIGKILSRAHILIDLDVSSKKRVFEQVGLLIENTCGIARSEVFDCLFARENWALPAWVRAWPSPMAERRA
jgi:PTS system nitrogen regulatory IIA component